MKVRDGLGFIRSLERAIADRISDRHVAADRHDGLYESLIYAPWDGEGQIMSVTMKGNVGHLKLTRLRGQVLLIGQDIEIHFESKFSRFCVIAPNTVEIVRGEAASPRDPRRTMVTKHSTQGMDYETWGANGRCFARIIGTGLLLQGASEEQVKILALDRIGAMPSTPGRSAMDVRIRAGTHVRSGGISENEDEKD